MVRAGRSARHESLRYAPSVPGPQRRAASHPACLPLIIVTGRWKPRSPPGEQFRGASGPQMSEKRRKTAPENSSKDPGIVLDMVLRGVILSDNNNYRKPENPPSRVDFCVHKRLFFLEIPRRHLYSLTDEAGERNEAPERSQGMETAADPEGWLLAMTTGATPPDPEQDTALTRRPARPA